MLATHRPDAVVVALPTAAHAAATALALENGCDVYVEKPLATSLGDADAVVRLWRAGNRIGMMGFNARFNPLVRRLRELVLEGRAGTPVYVRTVFSLAPREMPDWKRRRETGGGALLDLGSHHVDLARFIFDREPVSARATIESRQTEDDTVLLEMELRAGPRVHSFHSLCAAELDQIDVHGDRARLFVSRFTSLDVIVRDNPGRGGAAGRWLRSAAALRQLGRALRARQSPLREPGYALALDRFLEGVRTRRLPPDAPDLAAGLTCAAVVDAAERSARSGRPETVRTTPAP
jgi:predicted dehydrogenase